MIENRSSVDPDISRGGRVLRARELKVWDMPFILVYRADEDTVLVRTIAGRQWPSAEAVGVARQKNRHNMLSHRLLEENVKPVTNLQSRIEKLPRRAQRDIERAAQILREEFAEAAAREKAEPRRGGQILKIILFGSYSKGKQIVDPVGRYFSDYDLLVVVDDEELTDAARYWKHAEDRVVDMLTDRGWPQPLSLIIHTLDDVNHQLSRGRYFWVDLGRELINPR